MTHEPLRSIFHIKASGGTRHKIATMAFAVIAAEKGFKVEDNSRIVPQKGDELPDLVISKADRFHDGAKRYNKVLRWAIEVVDTHDPKRAENWPGYEDTIRLYIKKAEEWCLDSHGEHQGVTLFPEKHYSYPHPLCLDSLIREIERSLPQMEMENWSRRDLEWAIRWWTSISDGADPKIHPTHYLRMRLAKLIEGAREALKRRDALFAKRRKVTRKR